MDLQDIHAIAEITAAVAVVGSLVFVGIQLRQATLATKASNEQAALNNWNHMCMALATNDGLHAALINSTHPDLKPLVNMGADQSRLHYLMTAGMKTIEGNYLNWKNGSLSDDTWHGFNESLIQMFTFNTAWSDYWEMSQDLHSEPFRDLVEEIIRAAELNRAELKASLNNQT